jgi:hypothetical protein
MIRVTESQNRNSRLIPLRLKLLHVKFLLKLIEHNEQSGECFGNTDRWALKRDAIKTQLKNSIGPAASGEAPE